MGTIAGSGHHYVTAYPASPTNSGSRCFGTISSPDTDANSNATTSAACDAAASA
jgi:hypothetical protein